VYVFHRPYGEARPFLSDRRKPEIKPKLEKAGMGKARAESAKMCPAAGMSDWIFHQEKSNFPNAGSGIPMLILL